MKYNIQDVADLMGMTLKTVRRFVASGELKTTKKNNCYNITPEDFEDFKKYIEENKRNRCLQKAPSLFKKRGDNVNWVDINNHWNEPGKSEMTFVDLFCGAGGLSKGLEMSGLEGIWWVRLF